MAIYSVLMFDLISDDCANRKVRMKNKHNFKWWVKSYSSNQKAWVGEEKNLKRIGAIYRPFKIKKRERQTKNSNFYTEFSMSKKNYRNCILSGYESQSLHYLVSII